MRLWPALLITLLLATACSRPPDPGAMQPAPSARIAAISDAKPELYPSLKDMKKWRNPYLIIRKDAVQLLDADDNEEHVLKPEEVLPALANLPASAWPYGRVVAVQESGVTSEDDKVEMRRIKGIVAGSLEELHVVIDWVPSA